MLNKHLLIGNVGADPVCGQTSDGNFYARFRLGTTERSFTTARGQVVPERTTWHNIECWGGLARVVSENVHVGDKLYVEGICHTREYEKDGQHLVWHSTDISYLEFLTPKNKQTTQPTAQPAQPAAQPAAQIVQAAATAQPAAQQAPAIQPAQPAAQPAAVAQEIVIAPASFAAEPPLPF